MTSYVISSGSTSAYTLKPGDKLVVSSGGESDGSIVSSGATESVLSTGLSFDDTLLSGGTMILSTGAMAESVTVSFGGVVSAGVATLDGTNTVAGRLVSGSLGDLNAEGEPLLYGALEIASGGLAQDLRIAYGGAEIQAGGSALSASLVGNLGDTYATLSVDAGGKATDTTVGLTQLVYDYGVVSDTVLSGGQDMVYGSAVSTTVDVYGNEIVEGGGVALDGSVASGGLQTVEAGGLASKTKVASSGTFALSGGGVAASVVVESGGFADLVVTVSKGQTLSEGGVASALHAAVVVSGVTVESGAYLSLLDPVIESGGVVVQAAGAGLSGLKVSAGGKLSGGDIVGGEEYTYDANTDAGLVEDVTLSATYFERGELQVLSGGEAETVNVGANDELDVQSGGVGSAVVVSGPGSLLQVDAGGYVHVATIGGTPTSVGQSASVLGSSADVVVKAGGFEVVGSGGSATRTTVSSGGQQLVLSGADAIDTVVKAGGEILLSQGGSATGGIVSSGGLAIVSVDVASGQTFELPASVVTEAESLDGLTVSSGGILQITNATVESGGRLDLEGHVLGDGVTVSFGGIVVGAGTLLEATADLGTVEKATVGDAAGDAARLDVGSGGLAETITVLNAGVAVQSGGVGKTLTISSGGDVTVDSGGQIIGAQTRAGGSLGIVFGAAVSSATVSSGATLTLSQGVIAAGATATAGLAATSVASGGATALSGAILDRADTVVSSRAVLDLGADGQADSLSISSGGTVSGAGRLVGATFNAGAVSGVVLAGFMEDTGRIHGATLSSGAALQIQGVAASDIVSSGASVVVQSGGVASAMTLRTGAAQTVLAGGVSDSTTVSSGAAQVVSSGGVDSGTVVKAGGSETLYYGAVTSAVTISSGGTAVLEEAIVSSGVTVVLRATGSAASIDGVSGLAGATLHLAETFVNSGGTLSLAAGASYDQVHVLAGGTLLGPGDIGDDDVVPEGQFDSSTHQFVDWGLISGVTVGMSGLADLSIMAGGVIDNVRDYASIQVSSGGRASAITLESASAALGIDSGGVASRIVVDQGEVQVAGSATNIVASSGSLVSVDGRATSVSVASNTELWVGAGGVVSVASVAAGGALLLDLNGTVVGGTVASGGALILDDDGETLHSGATLSVGALAATTTVDGVVISKGGFENVADLDVASGATVSFGGGGALGSVDIQSGAIVKGAGVIYGQSEIYGAVSGITAETNPDYTPLPYLLEEYPLLQNVTPEQVVESGGSASALTVGSGGYAYVAAGGAVTSYVVGASGTLSVDGKATSGQVKSGGFMILGSGVLTDATVLSGGTLRDTNAVTVSAGAKAVQGTQIAVSSIGGARVSVGAIVEYAQATVLSGGVMSLNASVLNLLDYDDSLLVSSGGVVSGSGMYDGAITDFGLVSGVKLGSAAGYPYGIQEVGLIVASGGAASAVTVLFDSTLLVDSGGRIVDAVIDGGGSGSDAYGRETVTSGGVASGGAVLSNGSAFFASGATVKGVVVSSGGNVTLGFGVASGQHVSVATSAPTATTVLDGVTIDAGAYLLLSGVGVSSGGELLLGSSAVADDLTISAGGVVSGGILNAFNGAVTQDDGVLEDARNVGALTVGSGGVGRNLTIVDSTLSIDSGGAVSGVEIQPGVESYIQVNAGAVLDDAVIDAAPGVGRESINVFGAATDDAIGSGGVETVQAGGVDIGAVIRNGGEFVGNGGVVSGATVLSGGEYVNGAAQAEAVFISSGGRDLVTSYA
jgi:autotransporter passenger strand-loop-strand repeat protein